MERSDSTLSFDVFDTALTRIWFKPVDLFFAVGRELAHAGLHFTPQSWAAAREAAEHDLRRALTSTTSAASEEISLSAVYDELAVRLGLSPAIRSAALAIELDLERVAVRPIALTRAAILAAQTAGVSVVFLSDTYFDQTFVVDLLRRTGIEPDVHALYTSLALGYTKRTGSLFIHVLARRGLTPSAIRHLGDNASSDVASARRVGIETELFRIQQPNRYEEQLYAPKPDAPRLLRAAAAGAARAARLGRHETSVRRCVLAQTGADVAGPMLTGFVLWVLVEAHGRGLKRLYFLARDGQILQRIAARLLAWLGWDMELRYLYASRQALFLPSITAFDDATRDWLLEDAREMTLRTILSRIELDPLAETTILSAAGFPPQTWDQPLGADGRMRLNALTQRPDFIERALAQAQTHRALLLDYLAQEGFMDGHPFGLVDIGWKGRLQRCLAQALATRPAMTPERLTGFYYGLARRPDPAIAGELVAYVDAPLPNAALLETFVKADHGSVRRFCRAADGSVQPELMQTQDLEALAWGLSAQQAGILDFVDLMLSVLKPVDASPQAMVNFLRDRGRAVFDLFSCFPTPAEAAAYGSLRHAADQTHANPTDTAPVVERSRLLSLFIRRHSDIDKHNPWPEGSIARSTAASGIERRVLLALWELRRRAAACLRGHRLH